VATARLPTLVEAGTSDAVLRRLQLAVRRRLDGMLQGDHRGLVPGHGTELGETRVYQVGDDVRRIDWAVTARTGETHIRETEADRELETTLVVDLSASLDFGTARSTKRDLAVAAAAAFGLLTARSGNRMGAVVLGPHGLRRIPPRTGHDPLLALLHTVVTTPSEDTGAPSLAEGLWSVVSTARRRGLVVVVSDFLAPPDRDATGAPGWEGPLRVLGARHDTVCVEVLDPRELELPDVGLLTLVDPETGRTLDVPTHKASLRRRYAEAAAAQRAAIVAAVRRAGAGHVQLRTDRDWLVDLARYVERRRREPAVGVTGARR